MQQSTVPSLDQQIQQVADEALQLARLQQQAGSLEEAAGLYRAILEMQPAHAQANYELGLLEMALGRLPAAIGCLAAALQAAPQEEQYWLSYLEALIAGGQLATARELLALGRQHGLQGAAVDALAARLSHDPAGATPEAGEIDAVTTLLVEERIDDAHRAAQSLTERFPQHGFGWTVLAAVYRIRGQLELALQAMQAGAAFAPDNANAFRNLAILLNDLGRHSEAQGQLRRALEIEPDDAKAWDSLAISLQGQGRLTEAEAAVRRALTLSPDSANSHNNLGNNLQFQSRPAEAVAAYRRALELQPDCADFHSNLLFCLSTMDGIDAAELFAEHRAYAQRIEAPLRSLWCGHDNARDPVRCLRIGFVSGDLRNHAVASFIEPVLACFSGRPGLALFAYHNHPVHDHVTARLRGYMTAWHDIFGQRDETVADRIRADGIDILIDLAGHTGYNRLPLFSRKPAPLQLSWIGYPGTTGLESMDYYLSDRYLLPPGQFDHQFTEQLVHLPVGAPFQPALDAPPVNALPALTNGYITFGSFNRLSKVSRRVIATWAKLLHVLPGSRLLLGAMPEDGDNEPVATWLAENGIGAERLSFHPRADLHAYLALHQQVDICLDTFPYSGGTTTLQALWMGVPTLTLAGDTAAGRQTACTLEHFALQQFIARDGDDFVEKGVAICTDLGALAQLRGELRARFILASSDSLTNIADGVESALRTMWQRWCAGQEPATFEVPLGTKGMGVDGL
jgi:predicted O-linked N-acetylglucosamine transferase (SPINDLY family)